MANNRNHWSLYVNLFFKYVSQHKMYILLMLRKCSLRCQSIPQHSNTFLNHKNHNTVKALIRITPSGVASFISDSYGGNICYKSKHSYQNYWFYLNLVIQSWLIMDVPKRTSCHLELFWTFHHVQTKFVNQLPLR